MSLNETIPIASNGPSSSSSSSSRRDNTMKDMSWYTWFHRYKKYILSITCLLGFVVKMLTISLPETTNMKYNDEYWATISETLTTAMLILYNNDTTNISSIITPTTNTNKTTTTITTTTTAFNNTTPIIRIKNNEKIKTRTKTKTTSRGSNGTTGSFIKYPTSLNNNNISINDNNNNTIYEPLNIQELNERIRQRQNLRKKNVIVNNNNNSSNKNQVSLVRQSYKERMDKIKTTRLKYSRVRPDRRNNILLTGDQKHLPQRLANETIVSMTGLNKIELNELYTQRAIEYKQIQHNHNKNKPQYRKFPQNKIFYFVHIHKSAGTTMCTNAYKNKLSVNKIRNCNVQIDQKCCGYNDTIHSQIQYANTTIFDFIAIEQEMYDTMSIDHYIYVITLRNSYNRYLSHWHHFVREIINLENNKKHQLMIGKRLYEKHLQNNQRRRRNKKGGEQEDEEEQQQLQQRRKEGKTRLERRRAQQKFLQDQRKKQLEQQQQLQLLEGGKTDLELRLGKHQEFVREQRKRRKEQQQQQIEKLVQNGQYKRITTKSGKNKYVKVPSASSQQQQQQRRYLLSSKNVPITTNTTKTSTPPTTATNTKDNPPPPPTTTTKKKEPVVAVKGVVAGATAAATTKTRTTTITNTTKISFIDWWKGQPDNYNTRIICGPKCLIKPKYKITKDLFQYTLDRLQLFEDILFVEDFKKSYEQFAAKYNWKKTITSKQNNKKPLTPQKYQNEKEKSLKSSITTTTTNNNEDDDNNKKNWDPLMSALDDAIYEFAKRKVSKIQPYNKFSNQIQQTLDLYFIEGPKRQCTSLCCAPKCSGY